MAQVDFTPERLEGPMLAVTIYNPEALSPAALARIEGFRKEAASLGQEPVVYAPSGDYVPADRKSRMTLNRSNGGAVYFNDDARLDEILGEDPDVVILRHRIREQLYASILVVGTLVLLVLVRVLCKLLVRKK